MHGSKENELPNKWVSENESEKARQQKKRVGGFVSGSGLENTRDVQEIKWRD